jgi:Secretion system C-terminal sorting domain
VPTNTDQQGRPTDSSHVPKPFRFFPNPTRDYLTIEHERPIDELFVMDITGKVLLRETPLQRTTRLDMQPYPIGTYLFRFSAVQAWKSGCFLLNR